SHCAASRRRPGSALSPYTPLFRSVALALPLLLVGGDPGGPPGGHLLDAVEVAKQQAAFELVTATHAPLVILLLSEVAITTVGAHPGTHEGQLSSGGDAALIPDGQDRPLHPVGAALV